MTRVQAAWIVGKTVASVVLTSIQQHDGYQQRDQALESITFTDGSAIFLDGLDNGNEGYAKAIYRKPPTKRKQRST